MNDISEDSYGDGDDDSLLGDKDMQQEFMEKLLDFDYELSNEKINGDKATVEVKVTTYDMGLAFQQFMSEYFSQALALAFSDVTDEQIEKLATNILDEKIKALKDKDYSGTAKIKLVKVDGEWKVDSLENLEETYDFDD